MKVSKDGKRLRRLSKWMFLYPPFLGAGISVKWVSKDATQYVIQLKRRWYNGNVYGSHFGGSLYAMVDPFFVFAAAAHFGKGYILWDKKASIDYISPGKGTVTAEIGISKEELRAMKVEVDQKGKATFDFETQVKRSDGTIVAHVTKQIYIRKKTGMDGA